MAIDKSQHRFVSLKCTACGFLYDVLMNCGDRLCPACASRRFGVLLNRYSPFFETVPVSSLVFLTVTLRNEPDLALMHEKLIGCVHRLIAYGKKHWGWQGGVVGYEATNKGKGWHDHAHLVIMGARYVSQDEISKVWLSITGDSYIVDIRRVLSSVGALSYLVGYVTKVDNVFAPFHEEYNRVFKGRRLLQSWGTWFNKMFVDDDGEKEFLCPECGESNWVDSFAIGFYTQGARPLIVPRPGSSP
jgi:predicted RNA-binding Zn-ribbon protein involved in translation (DUF1610 family)